MSLSFSSFFFQAEDGIRDFHVTGVQTCALPISNLDYLINTLAHLESLGIREPELQRVLNVIGCHFARGRSDRGSPGVAALLKLRSEERRVGKKCVSRGSAVPWK